MIEKKSTLILAAMECEEQALIAGLTYEEIRYGTRLPITAKRIHLATSELTICRCGVGLVNAGVLVAKLVEYQPVDQVILLGVGGALDPSLEVGDTVVATGVVQHDSIASSDQGSFNIAAGDTVYSKPKDQWLDPLIPCDADLVDRVATALTISHRGKVFKGTLVSGSEFVGSKARKQLLRSQWDDALMVDMEAAAVAQVTRTLGIPFVAAKTVADRATPTHSIARDYLELLEAAAAHSRSVLDSILSAADFRERSPADR